MGRKQIGAMLLAAALALGTTGCGSMAADGGSALAGGSARDEAMERTRGEGEAAGESSGAGITEQIQAVGGAAREASGIGIAEQPQAGDEADGEAGGAGRESTGNRNASAKEGFRAAEGYEQLLVLLRERAGNGYIEGNLYFAMDSMNSLMQAEGSSLDSNFSDPAGSAAASGSVEDSSMSGPDYSDTNVQVEGIAEADIVKTDGKYLYILSGEADGTARVSIVNVQDGAMELAASFVPEEEEGEYYNGEMYISGDTLVLVRECRKTVRRIKEQDGDMLWENRIYLWNGWRTNEQETQILVYNIADRTAPVLAAQHSQDGRVVSSREKDGWLYVISEKDSMTFGIWELDQAPVRINTIPGPDGAAQDGGENEDEPVSGLSETEMKCLPKADGELLPANRIYFSEEYGSSAYTIVTSIRLSEPDCFADSLSFMTGSSGCYVSAEAVYLTAYDWMPNFELESVWELDEEGDTEAAKKEKTETGEVSKEEIPETKNTGENEGTQNSTEAGGNSGEDSSDRTRIIKLGYADGKLSVLAQGSVKGSIDSQFSMDERNGYLRLVTTVEHYGPAEDEEYSWREYKGRTNSLYVLDSELRTAGALENLAEDESIYSARFLGNIAYFVTYRNTDPLFSVDLTDPEHPRLLGALKLPGFSDYLQPYGDGMLLGIGYDTDEAGNATGCIKLTMFDITDPVNVVEKHTLILHEFSGSEACWNHKSVLASRERDLIGLPAEGYDYFDDGERYGSIYTKAYLVYGYDGERGFYPRLQKEYVNRWTGGRYTIEPVFEESAPDAGGKAGETGISQGGLSGGQSDETDMDRDSWYALRMRGIYIGDYLYVVNTEMEVISCRTEQERLEEYGRLNLRLR